MNLNITFAPIWGKVLALLPSRCKLLVELMYGPDQTGLGMPTGEEYISALRPCDLTLQRKL
jgi:hypothetical protein